MRAHTTWTRVHYATAQGQSASHAAAVRRTVAVGRSTIGYWQVVLPTQRAVTARQGRTRCQTTQLTQPSYLAHALCTNQVFHYQGVFGHRAIMVFLGDRDVAGGFN